MKGKIPALILAAAILITQGCSSKRDAAAEKENKAAAASPAIEVFNLQRGTVSAILKIPGELVSNQQVDIYAKVSGFVKRLYADVGTEVRAGQLIATLEAPEMNSQVSGAQSRIAAQSAAHQSSKATYDRLLATSKTPGTVSQNELDVAAARQKSDYAQLQAARASYDEVGANRNYLEIRASFAGIISARNVSTGAYVGPTGKGSEQPLFTLQEARRLRLKVSIPANYSGSLEPGTPVTFTVKSLPNQKFSAKVSRLAGSLDARYRSQHMEMDVDNSDHKLMPGMVAEVSLQPTPNNDVFVVPATAVLNATTGVFVIGVSNGRTTWIPATAGQSAEGKTEVFADALHAGDTLVSIASEEIRDGEAVNRIQLQAKGASNL